MWIRGAKKAGEDYDTSGLHLTGSSAGETFEPRFVELDNSVDIYAAINDGRAITSLEDAIEVFSGIGQKGVDEQRSALQYLWLYAVDPHVTNDDEKIDLIKTQIYEVLEPVHARLSPGDVNDVLPVVLRYLESAIE